MTEGDRPGPDGLGARLDRLELELARLAEEIAAIRVLAVEPESAQPAPVTTQVPPAAPRETETPPAPWTEPPPFWPTSPTEDVPARTPTGRSVPPPPPPQPAQPPRASLQPSEPPRPSQTPQPPSAPPAPPGRTLGELARDWDLVGARGFAIAGGAVMALGIGLFFVLAADRGWIGPEARIALGGTVATLVFVAGLVLRARYGQYWTALAAVGAGIAGAYATLAAAAARYDLVPDWFALPLAGVIAAVATVVALRWHSQLIAALGLLGAALAPALQALDTDLSWESAAFAVLVLVATAVVTVSRRWYPLLGAVSVLVGLQVEWLAADPEPGFPEATIAVASVFVLTLLGTAIALQWRAPKAEVDALALSWAFASFGITLVFAIQIFDDRTERGVTLLVAAGVWAIAFAATHWRRMPDLAFTLGASALALGAVGTADLLSDSALTIAWAAEALVLAVVARRIRDARLQALSILYAILATASAFVSEGNPRYLFDEGADHLAGALPLAAAAAGALGAGLLGPSEYRARTEAGLLAFLGYVREVLDAYRSRLREGLVYAGAALATLSVSFLLVSLSFEWGHVASSAVAATVGAAFLGAAAFLRSDSLVLAAYGWLLLVLVESLAFDGTEFEVGGESSGGWSVLAASAGLLGGSYALRVLQRERRVLDLVSGIAAAMTFATALVGVDLVATGDTFAGIGALGVGVLYAGLAAGIFGRERLRDMSTLLWSLALIALVITELLLVEDGVARTVLVAATALGVGCLDRPLREFRFWLAGAALTTLTFAVALVSEIEPWLDEDELRVALASGSCAVSAFAVAALRWRDSRVRNLTTIVWVDGLLALLVTERVLLGDWRATAFAVALTGAAVAALARPLGEGRLWLAGAVISGVTTAATFAALTPPSHFFSASESPAESLWVLLACVFALGVLAATAPDREGRIVVGVVTGVLALYAVSLAILDGAERISGSSIEADFQRGHTAVSGLWALLGLALLVAGLLRGSALLRYGGLALFGLSLAKIFLYDLAELSSVARAFSFILVGGLLLVGGFFLQRLSDRMGPRETETEIGT